MLRIRKGDVTIEADGEEAHRLACLVLGLEAKEGERASSPPQDGRGHKLGQFIECVRGRPTARILFAIARLGGAVKDSDLAKALGVAGNSQLAGSLGGIAKNAKRVELRTDEVLTRSKRRTHDGAVYTYRVPDDLRELILRELKNDGEAMGTLPTSG